MANNNYTALVERLFNEGYTKGKNPTVFGEVIAEGVKLYDNTASKAITGLDNFKKREANYLSAFPDRTLKIEKLLVSGDTVTVFWTVTATHKGDLPGGISATGNKINVSGISIMVFKGGKIAEIYQTWDRLGLLEQIGKTQLAGSLK